MTKALETIFILLLTSIVVIAANIVGYKGTLADSLLGVAIMLVIGVAGYVLSLLPGFNKVYMIVWVSVLAIFISSPLFPWSTQVVTLTAKVSFMAIATPILAYAGLAVGKDLAMFKKMSWRIVPVALAVCAGTFIFAAMIAHLALKWEGVI